VLRTARLLIDSGVLTPEDVLERYEAKRTNVIELADQISTLPQLDSATAVMAPLLSASDQVRAAVPASLIASVKSGETDTPVTVATAINRALHDILDRYPEAMIFGEDVARKGGVYGVTRGLLEDQFGAGVRHAARRAVDPRPALGAGVSGLLPIPRSSTCATFTTPPTRFAARARRCSSSPTAVPQSDGGPGGRLRYQKGSAGTFTTTTRSPRSATSPVSSSRRRAAR
jgi:2-oxoisovalerate dehydrogenase E1 component